MNILILLALSLSIPAYATSRIEQPLQKASQDCLIRGRFQEAIAKRTVVNKGSKKINADSIYWSIDVLEVSDKSDCPNFGETLIRIRGATFQGDAQKPQITYAVDLTEPYLGSAVKLKITYSKGTDTYTNLKFAEWILRELVVE